MKNKKLYPKQKVMCMADFTHLEECNKTAYPYYGDILTIKEVLPHHNVEMYKLDIPLLTFEEYPLLYPLSYKKYNEDNDTYTENFMVFNPDSLNDLLDKNIENMDKLNRINQYKTDKTKTILTNEIDALMVYIISYTEGLLSGRTYNLDDFTLSFKNQDHYIIPTILSDKYKVLNYNFKFTVDYQSLEAEKIENVIFTNKKETMSLLHSIKENFKKEISKIIIV